MTHERWVCAACGEPIDRNGGSVLVFNDNPAAGRVGEYPIHPTQEGEPDDAPPAGPAGTDVLAWVQAQAAKAAIHAPVNIGFGAYHLECDPHQDLNPYRMPLVADAEDWMAWVLHLSEKSWMGRSDLARMVDFWFSGHGKNRPPLG